LSVEVFSLQGAPLCVLRLLNTSGLMAPCLFFICKNPQTFYSYPAAMQRSHWTPTLLLGPEVWRRIAIPYPAPKQYILCYYMPGDTVVERSIAEIANRVSALTRWDVINIGEKEYMRLVPWRRSVFDAGPSEFLGLLQNASFVITNSFHGTAFSINFGKPFIVPINLNIPPEKALSSRITSLLRTLGIGERLVSAGEQISQSNLFDIDYDRVAATLSQERQTSIEFLRTALEGGTM